MRRIQFICYLTAQLNGDLCAAALVSYTRPVADHSLKKRDEQVLNALTHKISLHFQNRFDVKFGFLRWCKLGRFLL